MYRPLLSLALLALLIVAAPSDAAPLCSIGTPLCCTGDADCDDGDACTGAETCDVPSGTCVGAAAPVCDDGNACTTETCDAATGCTTPVAIPGCVPCTTVAQCDDVNVCTTDACSAGRCEHTDNTAPCTDGDACTDGDVCQGGSCVPGGPTNCDDANACTTDACTAGGGCSHTAIAGCVPCTTGAQCDDTNGCTTDTCQAGRCQHTNNTASCTDNDACTTGDVCQGGSCVPGGPTNCDDGSACTTDACDAVAGCSHTTIAGCVPCTTVAQCNDTNGCTTDTCQAGRCQHTNNTAPCTDNDACTNGDVCQGGACVPGGPLPCDDANACTTDGCAATTGCTHATIANCVPCTTVAQCDDGNLCTSDACPAGRCTHTDNTSPCTDGNACTQVDVCQGGGCVGTTPVVCPTPDQCHTVGTCNTSTGTCTNPVRPDTASCDDADACTTTDHCTAGVCAGTPIRCDDGVPCTDDRCVGGTCAATPVDSRCDRGDCTLGVCRPADPAANLLGCISTPVGEGDRCTDDGFACTDDRCATGRCLHQPQDGACVATDQCLPALCRPEIEGHDAAGCLPTPQLATGTTCSEDGDACTDDRCQDGTCTHASVALKTFCSPVQGPYERALALAATARTLAADSTGWGDSPSPSARLLGVAFTLEAAADALAGRTAATPAVTQARASNPFGTTPAQERGRVAFTQVKNTPGAVRAFLQDLSAAKARAALAAQTAAELRRRGRELLRGTKTLKRDLRRLQGVRTTLAR